MTQLFINLVFEAKIFGQNKRKEIVRIQQSWSGKLTFPSIGFHHIVDVDIGYFLDLIQKWI